MPSLPEDLVLATAIRTSTNTTEPLEIVQTLIVLEVIPRLQINPLKLLSQIDNKKQCYVLAKK